ncbi:MAG: hypothetical protein DRP57_01795 [Spirochaetes bacterium]|nr:MAG: hypothetical protein DRP57_01795 [Spirochaetota bacterium]
MNLHIKSDGHEILENIRWQESLGPRFPGSQAHKILKKHIIDAAAGFCDEVYKQNFKIILKGNEIECTNIIAVLRSQYGKPVLLGTHFDTRLIGDREKDPRLKNKPIPGANDGGSGTAVLLNLLKLFKEIKYRRDIFVVFFDAEDIGGMENYQFSVGAEFYVDNTVPEKPEEAIILDMVGGKDMVFDYDLNALSHTGSLKLTEEIREIGTKKRYEPFTKINNTKYKYIISDHYPFLRKKISSAILIDIDYPQWHTQGDTSDALSAESLRVTEEVLLAYLERYRL